MPEVRDGGDDAGFLLRWGVLVVALVLGGLLLAARAGDAFTTAFGLLLAAFGVLLIGRLVARVLP